MKIRVSPGGTTTVTLSRRNVVALLHKLDMPGSARTIVRTADPLDPLVEPALVLRVEDDDEHYADRTPGPMHPHTEEFIARGQD